MHHPNNLGRQYVNGQQQSPRAQTPHTPRIPTRVLLAFSLLVGLLIPGAVPAQPATSVGTSDPIVVTASVVPTDLGKSTAHVTVLDREWIEAEHAQSMLELLRCVPGLHVDQTGGRGGTSSAYLRGLDPNLTLVLIDGVRVNDSMNTRGGAFDFATLNGANVERVEIVRGPLSAVYGSDAMAGAIAIVTRTGTPEPVREIELGGGAFESFNGAIRVLGAERAFTYGIWSAWAGERGAVEGDVFEGWNSGTTLGFALSDSMQVRVALRQNHTHRESFPDDSGGPEFAVIRDTEKKDAVELSGTVTFLHAPSAAWEYRVRLTGFDRNEEITAPGVAPGPRDPFGIPAFETDNSFTPYSAEIRVLMSPRDTLRIGFGAQATVEKGIGAGQLLPGSVSIPVDFEMDRNVWSPFFELRVEPAPQWVLQGGLRVDVPDELDAEISPRLGLAYEIAKTGTKLRGNWGEGFKLPSFFALSHPVVGNPDLAAEKSWSADAGIHQPFCDERFAVDLTYFFSDVTDAVDLQEGPPPMLVNRTDVVAQGVELEMEAKVSRTLNVAGNVTWTDTDIKDTNEELRNRPELRAALVARWRPTTKLDLLLKTLYVGESLDSSIPTGDRNLDEYVRVDLAATWAATRHIKVFVAVDNVLDAQYEEFVGFAAPGIAPRGGVRVSF